MRLAVFSLWSEYFLRHMDLIHFVIIDQQDDAVVCMAETRAEYSNCCLTQRGCVQASGDTFDVAYGRFLGVGMVGTLCVPPDVRFIVAVFLFKGKEDKS